MGKWKFDDNSAFVDAAIERAIRAGLEEAGGEFAAQAKRNSRVDTGDTKASIDHKLDGRSVLVGSNAENAIWEEFGTGIHAEKGDGRKTPWVYKDRKGKFHRTSGKRGTRALSKAMRSKAATAKRLIEAKLGAIK
ncbi:MAG: HK97 gp10 family phage protein [Gordonibacter sp.]|uniref:HK97 gp10 family phage protein n=1 Tax=Gordonibacter sp. TaxID=1968902 RepID=UPI002FC5EC75